MFGMATTGDLAVRMGDIAAELCNRMMREDFL